MTIFFKTIFLVIIIGLFQFSNIYCQVDKTDAEIILEKANTYGIILEKADINLVSKDLKAIEKSTDKAGFAESKTDSAKISYMDTVFLRLNKQYNENHQQKFLFQTSSYQEIRNDIFRSIANVVIQSIPENINVTCNSVFLGTTPLEQGFDCNTKLEFIFTCNGYRSKTVPKIFPSFPKNQIFPVKLDKN
jgi:hypothetical protein